MENQGTTTTENQDKKEQEQKRPKTYDELFGEIKPRDKYSSSTFSVIYGDVGCGKTILATTAQELGKCVLINFENRISHIDETPNLRIIPRSKSEHREDIACDYDSFTSFIKYIKNYNIKFDYIIIDTLDEMLNRFLANAKTSGAMEKGNFFGRDNVYNEIWDYLKTIKDLGISIIATCHKKTSGDVGLKMDLSLTDKFKDRINMTIDNIFYLKKTDETTRTLMLKSSEDFYVAKLTTKPEKYNDIPSSIDNPKWVDVVEAIRGVE